MSKIKKVLAMLLALAMVLGTTLTAVAAPDIASKDATGKATDLGTINVSGITVEPGNTSLKVTAYKIIKANYANGGSFSGYESLYPSIINNVVPDAQGKVTVNDTQLTEIYNEIVALGTAGQEMTSADGSTYTADVEVGAYLVIITGAEARIYNPVVVSVSYGNSAGQTTMEQANVNVLDEENAWVKSEEHPELNKTIVDGQNNIKGNTANYGDTVNFLLTTKIPYYSGKYPKFAIKDTLNGLTYTEGSLIVKAGDVTLTKGTDYVLTTDTITNEINIDFVLENEYKLNDYEGKDLAVTYSATVNQDAELNGIANTNEAVLSYSKDSKVDGEPGKSDSKTNTYTFDIDGMAEGSLTNKLITKMGTTTTNEKEALNGAEFTLYTDADCQIKYGDVAKENKGFNGVVVTKDAGQMTMTGLKAGTYYLKETAAPAGYSLNDTVYKIEIKETIDSITGELKKWSITINGDTITNQGGAVSEFTVTEKGPEKVVTVPVEIVNTKLSSLPSTGGIGTTIFTIGGCLIMIVAAGLFFASRRKSAK